MPEYGVFDPIVQQLRAERIRQGLSAGQVGRRAGLRRPHLTKLENGQCDPQLKTVRRWAKALNFDLVLEARDG